MFEKRERLLYFLYGSNANPQQLAARGGLSERVAVAKLADFRLAFFGHSGTWDSGEETVVESLGDEVWGVLYRFSLGDSELFDAHQGARLDGTGPYFHFSVEVVDAEGRRHRALAYRKDSCRQVGLPSSELLAFMVEGALAQGLPASHIAELRALTSRAAGYSVPRRGPAPLTFSCAACGGCA